MARIEVGLGRLRRCRARRVGTRRRSQRSVRLRRGRNGPRLRRLGRLDRDRSVLVPQRLGRSRRRKRRIPQRRCGWRRTPARNPHRAPCRSRLGRPCRRHRLRPPSPAPTSRARTSSKWTPRRPLGRSRLGSRRSRTGPRLGQTCRRRSARTAFRVQPRNRTVRRRTPCSRWTLFPFGTVRLRTASTRPCR